MANQDGSVFTIFKLYSCNDQLPQFIKIMLENFPTIKKNEKND